MTRFCLFSGLLIFFGLSCNKEEVDTECVGRFYYYGSTRINFKETYTKGNISFYEVLSRDTINSILKKYGSLHYDDSSTYKKPNIFVDINSKNCWETDRLFAKIKKDSRISNCSKHIFFDEKSIYGVTDEFQCKLKDDSLENHLYNLINLTNTKILGAKNILGIYSIQADKNSNGDAIDMANLFYESGYFEFSEPAFFFNYIK